MKKDEEREERGGKAGAPEQELASPKTTHIFYDERNAPLRRPPRAQSLDVVAALLLLVLGDEERAFWMLVVFVQARARVPSLLLSPGQMQVARRCCSYKNKKVTRVCSPATLLSPLRTFSTRPATPTTSRAAGWSWTCLACSCGRALII